MAYHPDFDDPLAGGKKTPSLSWKGLPIGSIFTLEVLEPTRLLQSRNYDTNELDFWDAAKTQPVMSAVINVLVKSGPHSISEERSIWAQKPSNLFVALAEAQITAGARIAAGGTLHIKFDSEVPHKNTRLNHIKQYLVKYEPPVAQPDVFATPSRAAYTVTKAGAQPQTSSTPPAGWPEAARPAQTAQSPQAPLTVCQRTRLDPVTGQPGGICGETAMTLLHGQPVCAAHQAPTLPGTAQHGVGSSVPF